MIDLLNYHFSEVSVKLCVCVFREVHVHRGEVPAGASDGLLSDPDVHPQPPHRHPLLGLLLDPHGRGSGAGRARHHHRPHHDHTELRLTSLAAQGQRSKVTPLQHSTALHHKGRKQG